MVACMTVLLMASTTILQQAESLVEITAPKNLGAIVCEAVRAEGPVGATMNNVPAELRARLERGLLSWDGKVTILYNFKDDGKGKAKVTTWVPLVIVDGRSVLVIEF